MVTTRFFLSIRVSTACGFSWAFVWRIYAHNDGKELKDCLGLESEWRAWGFQSYTECVRKIRELEKGFPEKKKTVWEMRPIASPERDRQK